MNITPTGQAPDPAPKPKALGTGANRAKNFMCGEDAVLSRFERPGSKASPLGDPRSLNPNLSRFREIQWITVSIGMHPEGARRIISGARKAQDAHLSCRSSA